MHQRKLVVMEDDDEKRTMSWGEADDGLTYVRETTMGTVTEFAYGERFWETTFFFRPTKAYNLDDVADRVATSGDDYFLCDIADALEFWGIPYERGSHPPVRGLAIVEKDEKIGYAPCEMHGAFS